MNPRLWQRRDPAQRRMNCLQVTRVLQAYLDGETTGATARRVAAHLEDCRRCGLEASTYYEVKMALARRAAPSGEALARLHRFGDSLLHSNAHEPGGEGDKGPRAEG